MVLYHSILFHTHTSHLHVYTLLYDLQLCGWYMITQGTWVDLSQEENGILYS